MRTGNAAPRKRRYQIATETPETKGHGRRLTDEAANRVHQVPTAVFFERWLATRRTQLRPSTWRSYDNNIRTHIIPALGTRPLHRLTGDDLSVLYGALLDRGRRNGKGGLHPRTVKYIAMILKSALRDAVKWGVLGRNPAEAAEPPRVRTGAALTVWNADELRSFLRHVSQDRLYAAWLLSATTGMRRGELLGLRWKDVDLVAGTASISQTLLSVNFRVLLGQPKTSRGRRQIALFDVARDALREHRTRMAEEYRARGVNLTADQFIFTKQDGRPLHPDRFSRLFDIHVKAAGLPRIRLHDLRHTHATLGLSAGIHPKIMSERLGHSSVSITLDTYSHAIPGMQKEAADRMATVLFG